MNREIIVHDDNHSAPVTDKNQLPHLKKSGMIKTMIKQVKHMNKWTQALLLGGSVLFAASSLAQETHGVTLQWGVVEFADEYRLEEKLATDSSWTQLNPDADENVTKVSDTSIALSGRAAGDYEYRVIGCVIDPAQPATPLCDEVAEYSDDYAVTLPLLDIPEGAYWTDNRVFSGEEAVFSWRVIDGSECTNEYGESVGSTGRISVIPSSATVIKKTVTCNNKSFSDTLAVLANPAITLPPALPNPVDESTATVVGAIPDNFSVGPMGNAIYTMPIATAPGSGGLVPDISIGYDSGASNGLLGVGWSISGISVLRKCTKTKVDDNEIGLVDDKSRLCLDGKKLFSISGEYGATNTEYELIDRTPMKIVAGNKLVDDNVESYTVTMPNGLVHTYTSHSDKIWTLTKKQDAAGNFIVFNYGSSPDSVIIKSIQYTGNDNADKSPNNAIFFHYEGRDDIIVQRGRDVTVRLDYIESKVNVTDVSNAVGDELRTYAIDYKTEGADVSGRSLIETITSCAGNTCLPSTDFAWQEGNLNFADKVDIKIESNSDTKGQRALDANGDGITDFWIIDDDVASSGDHIRVVQGGNSPTLVDSNRHAATKNFRDSWQVIDFDSDGRDDVMFNDNGWKVYRSTIVNNNPATIHYDFANPVSVNLPSSVEDIKIADFNGDGFADILYYDAGHLYIQYSNTANDFLDAGDNVSPYELTDFFGTTIPEGHTGANHEEIQSYFADNSPIKNNIQVGDFDGDGKSEIVFAIPAYYRNRCFDSDYYADGNKVYYGEWKVYSLGNSSFTSNGNSPVGNWNSNNIEACNGDFGLIYNIEPDVITRLGIVDIDQDGFDEIASEHLINENTQKYSPLPLSIKLKIETGRDTQSIFSKKLILETDIFNGNLADLDEREYQYLFSDYNTDGYLDFLYYENEEVNTNNNVKVWKVAKFNGATFDTHEFTGIEYIYNPDGINTFVELNGDGVPDYISFQGHLNFQISQSNKRDLLTSITNGFGQTSTITYKSLADENASMFYTRENNAANLDDPRCQDNGDFCAKIVDVKIPINVVKQVTVQDQSETHYEYKGLKAQHGVGLLGFSEVVAFENKSDIRVTSNYHQVFPYTGNLYHTAVDQLTVFTVKQCDFNDTYGEYDCGITDSLNYTPLSSTDIAYAVYQDAECSTDGSQVSCPTYNEQFVYPKTITKKTFDVDNASTVLSSSTTTNTVLDEYGHIGTVTKVINDGNSDVATVVTNKGYGHLAAVYGGRLTSEQVSSSRPGEDTVTQAITYTYNASNNYLLETKEIDNAENLGSTTNDNLSANFNSKEAYTRDSFGNVILLVKTAASATTQATKYVYDSLGRYVETQSEYLDYDVNQSIDARISSSTTYDTILGLPLTITSANEQVTTNGYNALGRLNYTFNPDGSYATVTQELCATSNDCPTNGHYVETTTVSNGPNSKVYFDKKGLKLREKTQSLTNAVAGTIAWIQKDYAYDDLNRKVIESVPHISGGLDALSSASSYSASVLPPLGYSYTIFDNFNRVKSQFKPDHGEWKTAHQGLTSTSTNPDNMETTTVKNVLGEVVSVTDANDNVVTYKYNALGKMRYVSRAGDHGPVITQINFDHLGRKVKMTDPDIGVVQYRYDGFGNLLWQQDAKNQRKCNFYDGLGRLKESLNLTSASCSKDATLDAHLTYSYDLAMHGLGQVYYIYDHINQVGKQYYYNALSQVYRETTTVDGKSYFQDVVYDANNQFRIQKSYDSSSGNGGVEYHYSADNYLIGKTDLVSGDKIWELLTTDAWGNATEFKYANGTSTTKEFNQYDGTIESIFAKKEQNVIQNSEYHFTNVGNLEYRYENISGFEESFNYDSLNRLDDWTKTGGGASGTVDVNYDSLGNIAFKTGVGTYHYEGTAHAVSRISGGSAGNNLAVDYGYDANGNMTSGGGRSLINYNVNNKPVHINASGHITNFVYSIGDARIKRTDIKSGVTTNTLYIGNVEFVSENNQLTRIQRTIEGVAVETYYASTGMRDLEYLHFDHLGSAEVITDELGAVVKRFSFDPWGQRRSVDNYSTTYGFTSSLGLSLSYYNKGFTGHEHLDASGLIHMNGRVYDPRLGRFLSADPMVQQEYNLQNLNRYSYVLNNPLNATDPSGYFWAQLFTAVAEYFTSASFAQSVAMAAVSYSDNGSIQFTYSSADAFSYGQGAQRSLESQAFDSYDLGGRSNGLARAKAQANLDPGRVSSGVVGGDPQTGNFNSDNKVTTRNSFSPEERAEIKNKIQALTVDLRAGNYDSAYDASIALHEHEGLIKFGIDENIELWAVIDGKINSIIEVSTGFDSRYAKGIYNGKFSQRNGDAVWHSHPNGSDIHKGDFKSRIGPGHGIIFASGANLQSYDTSDSSFSSARSFKIENRPNEYKLPTSQYISNGRWYMFDQEWSR